MRNFVTTKLLDTEFKKIFYLHTLIPFGVVIVMEGLVGRRVGTLTYMLASIYMSYSIFRLWKHRSGASSTKQRNVLLVIASLLLLGCITQL